MKPPGEGGHTVRLPPSAKIAGRSAALLCGDREAETGGDAMSLIQEESTAEVSARQRPRRRRAARRALYEILLVAVLFTAYKIGRVAADGHVGEALANAE